jgi:hypothetical protein
MQRDTYVFAVWARRSAKSIFGPASNPVMVNGVLLCFKTEEKARVASDRLNARSGGTHVRYSVRSIRIQKKLPSRFAKAENAERRYAKPPAEVPLPGLAALRVAGPYRGMVGATGIEPVTPTMST